VSFIFQHACCLVLLVFSCIYISQGSVATQLWCGGIFNNCFIANCPKSVRVKEFRKLANICQRYGQLGYKVGHFFRHSVDRITIVPWRHRVNDIDLCRSPKLPKKLIKPLILAFKVLQGHWIRRQLKASVGLPISVINSLSPISHRYWDTATYWPKIANFAQPPLI